MSNTVLLAIVAGVFVVAVLRISPDVNAAPQIEDGHYVGFDTFDEFKVGKRIQKCIRKNELK